MLTDQHIYSHTTVGINNVRTLDKDVYYRDFTIPAGFTWDGASVPKAFRLIVPKWGENSIAYLLHDFLYSTQAPSTVSRKRADKILYEDLLTLGAGSIRAWLVYKTVDLFGASYFRKNTSK